MQMHEVHQSDHDGIYVSDDGTRFHMVVYNPTLCPVCTKPLDGYVCIPLEATYAHQTGEQIHLACFKPGKAEILRA